MKPRKILPRRPISPSPFSGDDQIVGSRPETRYVRIGKRQDSVFWKNLRTSSIFFLAPTSNKWVFKGIGYWYKMASHRYALLISYSKFGRVWDELVTPREKLHYFEKKSKWRQLSKEKNNLRLGKILIYGLTDPIFWKCAEEQDFSFSRFQALFPFFLAFFFFENRGCKAVDDKYRTYYITIF